MNPLRLCLFLMLAATLPIFGQRTAEQDRREFFSMNPPELPTELRDAEWRIPVLPTPENIDPLLEQLAAPTYRERRGAAVELRALGLQAGPLLLEHVRSPEPEIAFGTRDILRQITADHGDHHFQLALVREIERGVQSTETVELARKLKQTETENSLFAARTLVENNRLSAILHASSFDRPDLAFWISLLGHQHGHPLFLGTLMKQKRGALPHALNPAQVAYLKRGASSDYPRLRAHCRKWAVAFGLDVGDGLSPLLDPDASVRNVAAVHLYANRPEHLEQLALRAIASGQVERQRLGVEWLSLAVHQTRRQQGADKRPGVERLDVLAPLLDHEDDGLRLRAAYAFVPPSVVYKPEKDRQVSASLDAHMLSEGKSEGFIKVADWMDGKTKEFPEGVLPSSYDNDFFDALKSHAPKHMSRVLRTLAKDLLAENGPRKDALHELANSIFALRFETLSPASWPMNAFGTLLEARLMLSTSDPLTYVSQEQFANHRPDFLLPVFEFGPIPADKGYAMIATATCADDPDAIAVLEKSLQHPSATHRMEAAMALAFLGQAAGRDAARLVLANEDASHTLRSKAAVALASMNDAASYPAISAAFESILDPTLYTTELTKARPRYLYSLREHRPKAAEEFVRLRLRSGKCSRCLSRAGYCNYCSRDTPTIQALALKWKIPPDPDKGPKNGEYAFIQFMLSDEPKAIDFVSLQALLPVPAGTKLDLRAQAAAKLDAFTGGKTTFADIVRDAPGTFSTEFSNWANSEAALPFLSEEKKAAVEDILREKAKLTSP